MQTKNQLYYQPPAIVRVLVDRHTTTGPNRIPERHMPIASIENCNVAAVKPRWSALRRLAAGALMAGLLLPVQPALADYLGTNTIRVFVDPADLPNIQNGLSIGTTFRLIGETTPGNTGSNSAQTGYNTFYPIPGMRIKAASIMRQTPTGLYVDIPALDTDAAYNNCGKRGCRAYANTSGTFKLGNGFINQVQQDTGIFYSTDPRTKFVPGTVPGLPPAPGGPAYGSVTPTGKLAILPTPLPVNNIWDRDQVIAFGIAAAISGNTGIGNTPMISPNAGTNWFGTGNFVAGPHSFYTNDYNPACGLGAGNTGSSTQVNSNTATFALNWANVGNVFNFDYSVTGTGFAYVATTGTTANQRLLNSLQCQGPWRRLKYNASKIGGPLKPDLSRNIAPTTLSNQADISNTGVPVEGTPYVGDDFGSGLLPDTTNAVRYVSGARRVGDIELFSMVVEITDPTTFINNLPRLCVSSQGSDTADISAKDNVWRYYEPIFSESSGSPNCLDFNASGNLFKQVTHTSSAPYSTITANSGAVVQLNDIITYSVKFTNTSGAQMNSVTLKDIVGAGIIVSGATAPLLQLVANTTTGCNRNFAGGYNATFSGGGTGGTFVSLGAGTNASPATWTNVANLPAGQSVTVYMCAKVTKGSLGDVVANQAQVGWTNQNNVSCGTFPCAVSEASSGLGNLLDGFVRLSPDGGFTPTVTGIPGVTVKLYVDANNNGAYDSATDTFFASATTASDGSFSFSALPAGNYILVQSVVSPYTVTGNVLRPGPSVNTPNSCPLTGSPANNSCNVIGSTTSAGIVVTATSVIHNRNFYNFVTPTPTLTKYFGAGPGTTAIDIDTSTTLTFVIDNTAPLSTARSGLSFTDTLPTGLRLFDNTNTPGLVSGTCTSPGFSYTMSPTPVFGGTVVNVTSLSIPAASKCSITVKVTNQPATINQACPDAPNFTNTGLGGNITNLVGMNDGIQASCVNVNPKKPVLTKAFNPTSITAGGVADLIFTIVNPAGNPALTAPGAGLSFFDQLPSGLQLADGLFSGTCAAGYFIKESASDGAPDITAGSLSLSVTNLSLAAGGPTSCTIIVHVTNVPGNIGSCPDGRFTNLKSTMSTGNIDNQVADPCLSVTEPNVLVTKTNPVLTGPVAGVYTVTYDVNVTNLNSNQAGVYTLTDTPGFPAGLTFDGNAHVVSSGGAAAVVDYPPVSGTPHTFATSQPIAIAATHTYQVSFKFHFNTSTPTQLACVTGTSGNGLFNAVHISGSTTMDANACIGVPFVAVLKSNPVASGPAAGVYTVTYKVEVKNSGSTGGVYTLTDTPGFPAGLNFVLLGSTVTPSGTGAGLDLPFVSPYTPNSGTPATYTANRPIAAGATHTYDVLMTFTAASELSNLACDQAGAGHGLYNAVNITGSNDGTSNACTGFQQVTITKTNPTLTGPVSGEFTVTYLVTVSNATGGANATYTLTDTPDFPTGLAFVTLGTTVTPGGAGAGLDGFSSPYTPASGTPVTYTTDRTIIAGATHTYTVAMKFTSTGNVSNLACNDTPANGLYNGVALSGGSSGSAFACTGVPQVKIAKTNPVLTGPNGSGQFTVTYLVTVSNSTGSAAGAYTLTDTPSFPAGLTFVTNGTTVVSAGGGAVVADYTPNSGTPQTFATNFAIAAGGVHTYTVAMKFTSNGNAPNLTCNEAPFHGLYNAATLTGSNPGSSNTCTGLPQVTILKNGASLSGPNGSGEYTVSYLLTVSNSTGSVAGVYTLTDTPAFPAGLTFVNGGTTVTPGGGGTLDVGASPYTPFSESPHTLATNLAIPAGTTHTYAVAMKFTTNGNASNLACVPGVPGKGLYNAANITGSNAGTSNDCTGLPQVTVAKTNPTLSGPVAGVWTITYTVTVSNTTGSVAGVYTLTDTPGFVAGMTFVSNGTSVVPSGAGAGLDGGFSSPYTPVNGTPQTYTANRAIAVGGVHVYTVAMQFTTNGTTTDLACVANTAGNGLYNAVNITGSNTGTSNACGTAPGAPSLGLAKTDNRTIVAPGGTTNYVLTVTNSGTAQTSGLLTIVDVLPVGMTIPAGAVTLTAGSASWSCSAALQVITCTSSSTIGANGAISVLAFTVNIAGNVLNGAQLTNRAQVGGGNDPETGTPTDTTAGGCTGTNTLTKGCATDTDTVEIPVPPPADIPTVSEYTLLLMMLMLALMGGIYARRIRR